MEQAPSDIVKDALRLAFMLAVQQAFSVYNMSSPTDKVSAAMHMRTGIRMARDSYVACLKACEEMTLNEDKT